VAGLLHAFASSHIQVPQDIRLVGYDIDMAAELVTPFSTICQPVGQLGPARCAARNRSDRPGPTGEAPR